MTQQKITDDLDALLGVLPTSVAEAVRKANQADKLLEIIMDLGRLPTARFVEEEIVLSRKEISRAEIDHVVNNTRDFDADNRSGLERTLHRISAIRNRRGTIVGLTCRVGRAVYGTINIIEDIIESGKSILMLGRPGVGKTTMLREAARILAESKRVVIVDTSNEIGGDGDVPHPAVGRARRMQVSTPSLQHEVMIEAVENHNPEVIVIDEIGRELEATAARTIAERGVQLIGTAHGNSLENLMLNPTLADLIGGIEAVTLSDEEARRRGTQKTVLERRAPPTFDVLIEIQHRDRLAIHMDIAASVDALLRGFPLPAEIRMRDQDGQIKIERAPLQTPVVPSTEFNGRNGRRIPTEGKTTGQIPARRSVSELEANRTTLQTIRIFPYGVAQNRLMQASKRLGVPAVVVKESGEADVLVTLRSYYRNRQKAVINAENSGTPIYVLRANTSAQIEQFLTDLFNLPSLQLPRQDLDAVRQQTRAAIDAVLNGERWVDMPPGPSTIRRLQHEMARRSNLVSHSYGKEPRRYVRIFRE
ncbi:MAG: AAA family ATPase [Anaerolineales bacterium]|nr:AAA family ATPase [Anaerolineales bacterium]